MNNQLLKAKIVEKNLTQVELAKRKKCSINTMNNLVNGKVPINLDDVVFFCNELNIVDDKEKCDIFLT